MSKPTPLIDAAIRAGCAGEHAVPCPQDALPGACPSECVLERVIMPTLRSIKPRDPTEEWLNHAFMALEGMESDAHLRVYRDALWHELYDQEG